MWAVFSQLDRDVREAGNLKSSLLLLATTCSNRCRGRVSLANTKFMSNAKRDWYVCVFKFEWELFTLVMY